MVKTVQTVEHTHDCYHKCGIRCVSWTAIIVGALVGLGLSFLFNLFGIAIGLTAFRINQGIMSLAMGGLIGILIGAIISTFVAGFVAGCLGRPVCARQSLGVLYGFTTWSLMLIVMILFTAHMGRYINAYSDSLVNPTRIYITDESQPYNQSMMTINTRNQMMRTTNPQSRTVSEEKAAGRLGLGAFIVFVLFFISAFSCCVGGLWGVSYKRDEECRIV